MKNKILTSIFTIIVMSFAANSARVDKLSSLTKSYMNYLYFKGADPYKLEALEEVNKIGASGIDIKSKALKSHFIYDLSENLNRLFEIKNCKLVLKSNPDNSLKSLFEDNMTDPKNITTLRHLIFLDQAITEALRSGNEEKTSITVGKVELKIKRQIQHQQTPTPSLNEMQIGSNPFGAGETKYKLEGDEKEYTEAQLKEFIRDNLTEDYISNNLMIENADDTTQTKFGELGDGRADVVANMKAHIDLAFAALTGKANVYKMQNS